MKKGSITIFLALTLTILLSLIMTVIEGARVNAMKLRIECVADMGITSGFAEFHRKLLEEYDLFFIDTSYGRQTSDIHHTTEHIKNYMEANFKPAKGWETVLFRDWFALSTQNVIALEYRTASQEAGLAMKRQAVTYWKQKMGISLAEDIRDEFLSVKQQKLDERNIAREQESIKTSIQQVELPEKTSIQNPADAVNGARGSGILEWVVDNQSQISTRSANLSNCYSVRKPKEQSGNTAPNTKMGMEEELLFGEYLIEKCGSYHLWKDKNYLRYQIEYILEGSNQDRENLKGTVNQLLLLREASNVTYLLSDGQKMAELDAMAAGLSIVALVPELQPLIKYSLLFAWSFAESINDVKILLNKGKVPIGKQREDWKLSLENMLLFQDHLSSGEKEGRGITYEQYLKVLLMLMNPEEKASRFMDMVELDLRQTPGNDKFRVDACIDYLKVEMVVSSKFHDSYRFTREYQYE